MIKKIYTLIRVLMVLIVLSPTITVVYGEVYNIAPQIEDSDCYISTSNEKEESTKTKTSSSIASDSDWTKKGTTAYNNAKKVFLAFVNRGTTGAFAAGVVGWTNSEGGFDIIGRAQGHYGTGLENSISKGAIPTTGGTSNTLGGGGIFQIDPYTRYAPLGSPDWEDADKMVNYVIQEVARGDWNPTHDLTGKNHSFEQAVQLTDPKEASLTWNAFERGNPAYIKNEQKTGDAQKAYELFEGQNYQFNEVKFKKTFGGDLSTSNNETEAKDSNQTTNDDCIEEDEETNNSSSQWTKDKTGKVNYQDFNVWKPKDLPNDLKQYALNPESLGMKYGSSDGWKQKAFSYGQCTDLSASLMYSLWDKNGEHPVQRMGNGYQVVENWTRTFGGKSSRTPTTGAVFSSVENGENGHTGVVSHVFENGDILICEQNYIKMSGDTIGIPATWNFRYVTTEYMEKENYTFYSPSEAGYKMVSDIKSY